MAYLEVERLGKSFGETAVLEQISVEVEQGETLVLLGPSGSGKTTLLRLVAGFERADTGVIRLAGEPVGELPPEARRFGMVFQHYALFPHLSVGENVAFGISGRSPAEVEDMVARALEQVELEGFAGRRVDAISGGQQQRVALARALAPRPRLLLLDEPLSNLDPDLRERTRQDLRATLDEIGITAVWVTHEQEEAFDVGSRVAILNRGRLEQVGRPEELYRRPATPFVARFVGRASILRGVLASSGSASIEVPGREAVPIAVWAPRDLVPGSALEIYVRPETWRVEDAGAEPAALTATVLSRRFVGRENLVALRVEPSAVELEVATESDCAPGSMVALVQREDAVPAAAFAAAGDAARGGR